MEKQKHGKDKNQQTKDWMCVWRWKGEIHLL